MTTPRVHWVGPNPSRRFVADPATPVRYHGSPGITLRVGVDLTACGQRSDRVQVGDPDDVTCLSCRRSTAFAPHRDDLDDMLVAADHRAKDRNQPHRPTALAWWEAFAVDVDQWMVRHGDCWRSRHLAKTCRDQLARWDFGLADCPTCQGTGDTGRNQHPRQWDRCPDCDGSGEKPQRFRVTRK